MDVKVEDHSDEVRTELELCLTKAFKEIAMAGETYAKLLCPVGTPESTGIPGYMGGTLRGSISHASETTAAHIGTDVEYAPYVELGTSKMDAQPYLKPAITEHLQEYRAIIERNLR